MSEVTDLVVIEKSSAMAVFTNNEQLDPIIEKLRKKLEAWYRMYPPRKVVMLSHPWRTRLRVQKHISTTPVKTL